MENIRQLFQSKYKNNIEKALTSLNYQRLSIINEMNSFKYHSRTTGQYASLLLQKERIEDKIKLVSELLK